MGSDETGKVVPNPSLPERGEFSQDLQRGIMSVASRRVVKGAEAKTGKKLTNTRRYDVFKEGKLIDQDRGKEGSTRKLTLR